MDVSEGATTEDLWTPYKELVAVVEGYLVREGGEAPYAVHTFESLLRRHKQTFLSLLKYPPKNPTSREEIKRGITEGVILPSIGKTMLSKELVDEAIIISDMYNVNEYLALELLHTAQRQAPRHPGLPRGLIAVVLLYDGRNALLQALRELLMAREGVCWSISARPEVITYVSRYVDQLIADGLIDNTLDSLRTYSLATELELLQNNRAIPPRKHYKRLVATIENTRKLMAGVVYTASAQRGLSGDVLLRVLNEQSKGVTRSPSGCLDDVSLALHMALLYALDLSVLHRRDDGEEVAKKLPLIQDANLISVLIDELSPPINPHQSALDAQEKASSGVRALCQLSLGLALAALKRAGGAICPSRDALLDQDESLVDAAIDGKVFEYIEEMILSNELSTKEEYYQLRLHMLITDFIVLMNSKLTEMRLKCEEASRAAAAFAAEGLYPGGVGAGGVGAGMNGAGSLDAFLRCVERLYAHDPRRLRDDYYPTPRQHHHPQHHRWGGRAAALHKAVRGWGAARRGGAAWRALGALAVTLHSATLALHHHVLCALHRYRDNLRHDTLGMEGVRSMGASAVVANRPARLLVRQEEVEGMISGLKLIAAIAKVDQAACISICENLQWDAINVMFGLISCQVPIELKAELCLTLAALGSYSSTSAAVWAALEASQLVGPPGTMRGLSLELHETECRMEEYPLSLAFVSLLIALCEAGCGATAGEPLVSHVLSRLTLPALHMRYRRPKDKWLLLSRCLKLLVLWLQNYEPLPSDIPDRSQQSMAPAGLQLAIQLHNESELLRLLLSLLHDVEQLQPAPSEEEEPHIRECVMNALYLVELGLSLERSLSQAIADSARSVPLIGLSKLILGSSRSGRCHVVSWCLCMCSSVCACVRVLRRGAALLRRALASPHAQRAAAHAPAHLAADIRHGFVECLETDDWSEDENSELIRETKEDILDILLQVLPTAAPNFAHYLLGFQMTEQISRCQLNEAGAGGFPRTCLHSILDLLENHIAGADNSNREATELIEKCYKLLYHLVARPNTSGPVLRFLRSRDRFLMRHLQATLDLERAECVSVWSRSWVVRACACAAPSDVLAAHTLTQHEWQQCLLGRLGEAPVTVQAVPTPRWELFHADQLRKAIVDADLPTGMGGKRISVSRLHALLAREMASLQATAPQRNMLALEIQKVLDYVTEVNRQRDLAAALTHYFDSWRQLTEILFCVSPQETLSLEDKKTLILNILQDLLNKIPPAEVLPQIGYLASGTVLLLLVNLRHCYILQKRESSLKSTDFETTFFGPSSQIMQSKSLTLKFILNKILSWILQAGSTQKMRVNLYGALLNFLNIVNLKTSPAELDEDMNDTFVSRLDQSVGRPNKEESALKSMVIDVISSYGHNLSAIVCSDCIGGGHDVCRMVALSCLDTLVEIYPQSDWMNTLTNQGYLRSLIDSLLQDDEELLQTLEPQPKSLRVLYVYESRMSLLRKIASSRLGAEAILCAGALSTLALLRALTLHPDTHTPTHHVQQAFMPSLPERFRQLLVPCMSLCDALLTAVGSHNHSCVIHVTHLLLAHLECVDCVLRAARPDSPKGLLIEVEAITSVIGRASNREVFGNAETDTALDRSRAALQRVKALMLQLLPRFCVTLPNIDDLELELTMYKIISNILTYVRNITSPLSNRALLAPSIDVSFAEGDDVQLGSVVQMLCGAVRRCHAHDKLLATATHHQANLHSMTIEDMKKLLPSEPQSQPQSWSPVEVRAAAASHLARRVRSRRSLARHCRYAAEAALYILWSHLHLYLRASVDTRDNAIGMTSMTALRGAYGEQLPELRKSLVAVFNDRFTEELLDIAKNQPASQRGFLEVLLKDIKSMIQFSPI